MDDIIASFLALSPGAQATSVIIVGSITFLTVKVALAVLLGVLHGIKRIIPSRSTKHGVSKNPTASSEPPTTPVTKAPPPPKGVSMKSLMKSAQKAKAAQGADHHADSELFLATLRGHTDRVTGLAFSSNGKALASGCEDRTLRVFDISDLNAKTIPFKTVDMRHGAVDVAFGLDADHVAVLTQGVLAEGSSLCLMDVSIKKGEATWTRENVFPLRGSGTTLKGSFGSSSGPGVLVIASEKPTMYIYSTTGTLLGSIDTGGMTIHDVAISKDGRFVAAATFTSDVKVYEVKFDRTGQFVGISKVMDLKGHKSRVLTLAFSPDVTKMVTCSADGTLKVWNIDVRYHQQEDPKLLLSTGLAVPKGSCYSHIAWGPDGYLAAVHGSNIHILDCRSGELVESITNAHSNEIKDIAWAPSRLQGPQGLTSIIASAGTDHRVRLWRGPWPLV